MFVISATCSSLISLPFMGLHFSDPMMNKEDKGTDVRSSSYKGRNMKKGTYMEVR